MIVNYWLLPIALLLLWLPRQWLRFGGKVISLPRPSRQSRDDHDTRDVSLKYREEFSKPRNWVDFLRAIAGSLAISYACFERAPEAVKSVSTEIFILQCVLLFVAVVIQTVRFEGKVTLSAPVFFILGLSFGIIGWKAALFACVAIWVINLVLPSVAIFLFVFAGLQVCFGLILPQQATTRSALLAAALAITPVLFSAITKRRLVRLNKKGRQSRRA
ncbi:hypothetical protein [Rariglobus hedericola]|uniref:Uncharacterized protein n=1 Tax=Rariglobus hedericola TaxID=2597822 RepID=A0A556QPD7_9BACT|nr:hypothetical protein [Rariglobus hedericola]TSJ78510.1 hypothetical protein FPL22_04200 [Rariglobus hedericola]